MLAHVLVVDDDKDFLQMVQKVLEMGGYAVVPSIDAFDAIDKLGKEIFDIILTDANMPGGSGFDLVKTIRKDRAFDQTAVALLTGRRDKRDIDRGMECGADDYIVKPLDPPIFLAKVASLVQKRKSTDRPEINFAECAVNMPVDWRVRSEILRINEQGMTLSGPISVAVNSKIKIDCDLFKTIELTPPYLRVVSCEAMPTNTHFFLTKVTFVGLTDQERQKIRYWINSNIALTKNKKVS